MSCAVDETNNLARNKSSTKCPVAIAIGHFVGGIKKQNVCIYISVSIHITTEKPDSPDKSDKLSFF